MSRFQVLSDAQWSLIEDMLPRPTSRQGRPFADARKMIEAIVYRYRTGTRGVTCPMPTGHGRQCGRGIGGWPRTALGTVS